MVWLRQNGGVIAIAIAAIIAAIAIAAIIAAIVIAWLPAAVRSQVAQGGHIRRRRGRSLLLATPRDT